MVKPSSPLLIWLSAGLPWLAVASINPYNYLELPSERELASSPLTVQIVQALEYLNVGRNESAVRLMDRIKSLADDNHRLGPPSVRPVYKQLAQLADGSDICPDQLVELIKHLLAMAKNRKGPVGKLDSLMRLFGLAKFDACVRRRDGHFHLRLGLFVEESLDDVLAAALGIKEGSLKKADDSEKYNKLKRLDLTSSDRKLKVKLMAKRAAKYEPKKADDLSLVIEFFHSKCNYLQTMLGSTVDLLTLARLFGADESAYRKRLLKIGEQRRLCLAVQGDKSRTRVKSNLATRFVRSPSWAAKLLRRVLSA